MEIFESSTTKFGNEEWILNFMTGQQTNPTDATEMLMMEIETL